MRGYDEVAGRSYFREPGPLVREGVGSQLRVLAAVKITKRANGMQLLLLLLIDTSTWPCCGLFRLKTKRV